MSLALKKGAAVAGAGMIYQQAISFLSGLILARLMGPAEYGLFNLIRSFALTIVVATKGGLDIGILRRLGETSGTEVEDHASDVVFGSCAFAVLVGVAVWGAVWAGFGQLIEIWFYPHTGVGMLMGLMFLILPFWGLLQVGSSALKGRGFIGSSIFVEMFLHPTLRLVISVAFLIMGMGLIGVIIGNVTAAVIAALVMIAALSQHFGQGTRLAKIQALVKETKPVLRYSMVLAGSVFIVTATRSMDIFFLGGYVPHDELGAYALIQVVVGVLPLFGAAFGQVMGPTVAKLWAQNDQHALAVLVRDNIRLVALTTLPIFFALCALGDYVIHSLWPRFPISLVVLLLLALSQLIFGVFSNAGWLLSMTGRHRLEAYILSAGLVTTVVACFFLVPRLGGEGAAIATLLGVVVQSAIRLGVVSRMLGANLIPKAVLSFTLFGAVAAYITRITAQKMLVSPPLLASLMISGCFIMAMLWFVYRSGLNEEERSAVRNGVSRVSHKLRGGK